ncbi:MAG: transporter substrate-binding domain-containing protein, partial [Oscillospiraceae bacterium]|nr:transporter substrate-binding domain-containing protein [Oscillospiraceae bacterium]
MKKKLTALLLAGVLCLGLVACGSKAEDTKEPEDTAEPDTVQTDMEYVKEKGVLVVGITDFAPMDYKDESGEWIGFDADMAKAFADSLGVDVEFVEIDWDNKILE